MSPPRRSAGAERALGLTYTGDQDHCEKRQQILDGQPGDYGLQHFHLHSRPRPILRSS
jgi:hypothetical protein